MTPLARVGSIVAGKYKLLHRLGGGGMGEVFRAEHQYAGRDVALKLLRADFASDADLTRRFFQEAQAVNKIRHPNIVDVLDAGLCEEGPYVAMELLEGSSLSAALSRVERFDLTATLAVVLPVLDALDAAHRHGIVHRDLKPENVFLAKTPAGVTVKLVDFGIAKVAGSSTNTSTGVVFGTPDYLSPEQASGEGEIDGRSDLFAVGIVLFELLTGRRPFAASSAIATAYRIVHAPAPTIASMGVASDTRVQEVLDVALTKSQAARFASAQSFADRLAPLVPDGAARRAALLGLLDAVTGLAPTIAVPLASSSTRGLEEEGEAAVHRERRSAPTPGAPESLVSPPPPPTTPTAARATTSPTLASARADVLRPYVIVDSDHHAPVATPALREPIGTPAARAPAVTPVTLRPAGTPAARPPPVAVPAAREARATPVVRDAIVSPRRISSPGLSAPPGTPRRVSAISSAPGRASKPWTPRLLPAHVRGKCHTRGSVPRAASRWVERAFGADAREEVFRAIPAELADAYRADGFNALVWYDIEALDTFLEATTALLLGGNVTAWRALARTHFDRDLGSIFRSGARAPDPVALLKRSIPAWGRLYDFASVRVSEPTTGGGAPPQRATVRFDGFDAASLALRNVTIGTVEGVLKSGLALDATSRVMSGEASFARDFEVEIAWRAPG